MLRQSSRLCSALVHMVVSLEHVVAALAHMVAALKHNRAALVQRHTWGRFTLSCCSLWCEGFAPLLVSSRVTIPPCVPLHHQRSDRVQG